MLVDGSEITPQCYGWGMVTAVERILQLIRCGVAERWVSLGYGCERGVKCLKRRVLLGIFLGARSELTVGSVAVSRLPCMFILLYASL